MFLVFGALGELWSKSLIQLIVGRMTCFPPLCSSAEEDSSPGRVRWRPGSYPGRVRWRPDSPTGRIRWRPADVWAKFSRLVLSWTENKMMDTLPCFCNRSSIFNLSGKIGLGTDEFRGESILNNSQKVHLLHQLALPVIGFQYSSAFELWIPGGEGVPHDGNIWTGFGDALALVQIQGIP